MTKPIRAMLPLGDHVVSSPAMTPGQPTGATAMTHHESRLSAFAQLHQDDPSTPTATAFDASVWQSLSLLNLKDTRPVPNSEIFPPLRTTSSANGGGRDSWRAVGSPPRSSTLAKRTSPTNEHTFDIPNVSTNDYHHPLAMNSFSLPSTVNMSTPSSMASSISNNLPVLDQDSIYGDGFYGIRESSAYTQYDSDSEGRVRSFSDVSDMTRSMSYESRSRSHSDTLGFNGQLFIRGGNNNSGGNAGSSLPLPVSSGFYAPNGIDYGRTNVRPVHYDAKTNSAEQLQPVSPQLMDFLGSDQNGDLPDELLDLPDLPDYDDSKFFDDDISFNMERSHFNNNGTVPPGFASTPYATNAPGINTPFPPMIHQGHTDSIGRDGHGSFRQTPSSLPMPISGHGAHARGMDSMGAYPIHTSYMDAPNPGVRGGTHRHQNISPPTVDDYLHHHIGAMTGGNTRNAWSQRNSNGNGNNNGHSSGGGGSGGGGSSSSSGEEDTLDMYEQTQMRRPHSNHSSNLSLRDAGSMRHIEYYTVEFKGGRRASYYVEDGRQQSFKIDDLVIVEADRGRDLGRVVDKGPHCTDSDPKQIIRQAYSPEVALMPTKAQEEIRALLTCQNKIRQKKLPMEVVDAEYQWDRRKLTFSFIADKRIDFRELVRELFKIYKTRIWMCLVDEKTTKKPGK